MRLKWYETACWLLANIKNTFQYVVLSHWKYFQCCLSATVWQKTLTLTDFKVLEGQLWSRVVQQNFSV